MPKPRRRPPAKKTSLKRPASRQRAQVQSGGDKTSGQPATRAAGRPAGSRSRLSVRFYRSQPAVNPEVHPRVGPDESGARPSPASRPEIGPAAAFPPAGSRANEPGSAASRFFSGRREAVMWGGVTIFMLLILFLWVANVENIFAPTRDDGFGLIRSEESSATRAELSETLRRMRENLAAFKTELAAIASSTVASETGMATTTMPAANGIDEADITALKKKLEARAGESAR